MKGFSCSCASLGKINEEQFKSYDLIVKGQIEKVEKGEWIRTIYVRIEQQYKGVIKSELVIIYTPSESGMCGIFPKVGETWLIFAQKDENSYSTILCTRTKNMNPEAWNYDKDEIDSDIKYLENKIKKK
jgi:hypothetical protein